MPIGRMRWAFGKWPKSSAKVKKQQQEMGRKVELHKEAESTNIYLVNRFALKLPVNIPKSTRLLTVFTYWPDLQYHL